MNAKQERQRQELAWHMRNTLGWTLERIGRKLGIGRSAVSRLLDRAGPEHSLPAQRNVGIARRRRIQPISLSLIRNV